MNWKRDKTTGAYSAGPYVVEPYSSGGGGWYASGPGVDEAHPLKADAQAACHDAALNRIVGSGATCEAVVGDRVTVSTVGRMDPRGRVTAILANTGPTQRPIYCVRFAIGGGRTCVFREEMEVILP